MGLAKERVALSKNCVAHPSSVSEVDQAKVAKAMHSPIWPFAIFFQLRCRVMKDRFQDRIQAGELLATRLLRYANRGDVVVLGLPRGGIPVAAEIAKKLNAPLDVFVVRKLGVPGHRELAMGAIAGGGIRVLNQALIFHLCIPGDVIEMVADEERQELYRREAAYRGDAARVELDNKIVILVDDGIATGSTMLAAAEAITQKKPRRVVIAVPVAPHSAGSELQKVADEVVVLLSPREFHAVGEWYEEFSQISDEEVRAFLAEARDKQKDTQTHFRNSPAPLSPPIKFQTQQLRKG
jgi:putative phosphoribosyl transferase